MDSGRLGKKQSIPCNRTRYGRPFLMSKNRVADKRIRVSGEIKFEERFTQIKSFFIEYAPTEMAQIAFLVRDKP